MKRILYIVPLPPPVHGHSVMCKYVLDNKLINDEFIVDAINLHTSRSMAEMDKKPLLKICRMLRALFRTFILLIRNKYEFVYIALTCHGGGLLKDMSFIYLCKLFHCKIVFHQHNQGVRHDMDRAPYKWIYPSLYGNVKVILLSWNLYDDISRYVKKEDVYICPNGIPTIEDSIVQVKNEVPHIFFLSNLLVEKGVYVLMDALAILKKKGLPFVCDFVGCETAEINKYQFDEYSASVGIEDRVIYHGPKFGNDKELYWNMADIFVLPTLNECYPLVLIEAMQHSLPCIASDEGAISDIINNNETGLVFAKGDAKQLADCLEKILVDPALGKQLGMRGFERYKEELTIQKFNYNIYNIFNQIVNNG